MRVENFGVRNKHSGGFQEGNMPYALLVSINMTINVLYQSCFQSFIQRLV